MRIRALLFVPALAAAALGIGASGASAATLFTTAGHGTRVTVGATATATSVGPIDLTDLAGGLQNRCTHSSLGLRVDDAGATSGRVAITVTSATFAAGCVPHQATGTTVTPWQLTITGHGTSTGGNLVFPATVHRVAFDLSDIPGVFSGNLETGVTASQPNAGTTPVCVNTAAAGTVSGAISGTIDARYCLTAATAWSLTST